MTLNDFLDGFRKATPNELIALGAHLNEVYCYELDLAAGPEDLLEEMEDEVDIDDLLGAYEKAVLKLDEAEEPDDDSDADSAEDGEAE
jgi:hypothetical protein